MKTSGRTDVSEQQRVESLTLSI